MQKLQTLNYRDYFRYDILIEIIWYAINSKQAFATCLEKRERERERGRGGGSHFHYNYVWFYDLINTSVSF